jgi:16S rRNA (adenine1518-N6/adenine1519-N6)-dimethyltransferase
MRHDRSSGLNVEKCLEFPVMAYPRLTDPAILKALLHKAGVQPQQWRSQNFLTCEEVLEATLEALKDGPKLITELGSGPGVVTQALVAAGYTVRAIEADRAVAEVMWQAIPPKGRAHVDLQLGDLRHIPWEQGDSWQLVGNIPYSLSGLILRRLTQLAQPPERVVFLVQKEVGQRLTASPPEMSLVALAVQLWGEVYELLTVPPQCFWPEPVVSSQLLMIIPHAAGATTPDEREAILRVAKVFFQGKRKQMGGVLRRHWQLSEDQVTAMLQTVGLKPIARPQELTIAQWHPLTKALTGLSK